MRSESKTGTGNPAAPDGDTHLPTAYTLLRSFHLPRRYELTPALLHNQPHGRPPPLLQSLKISSYSSWIPHV